MIVFNFVHNLRQRTKIIFSVGLARRCSLEMNIESLEASRLKTMNKVSLGDM